jgi:hypothetical protein
LPGTGKNSRSAAPVEGKILTSTADPCTVCSPRVETTCVTAPKRDTAERRRRKAALTLVAEQEAEFLRLAVLAADLNAKSKRVPRKPAPRRRAGKKS